MRLLRLTLLTNFFLKKKNLIRATRLIHIGIFFSLFAASTGVISFIIEGKINEKEYELLSNQKVIKDARDLTTWLKTNYYIYKSEQTQENKDYETELYNNETKFNFKLISPNDFYKPYIFFVIKEEQEFTKELENEDFIKYVKDYINLINDEDDFFKKEKKERYTQTIKVFELQRKKFIDTINYDLNEFLTNKKILFKEIRNVSSSSDLNFTNQLKEDYASSYEYRNSLIRFLDVIIEMFDEIILDTNIENQYMGDEIINLSKLERNLILITFIFQLAIFVIIQLFEISSINKDKKVKLI